MRRLVVASFAFLGLALAPPGGAGAQGISGDIGLRLLVQPWNPATDDETVRRAEHPRAISEAVAAAWFAAKPGLVEDMKARLGTPDIAPGITLRDIDLLLPDPWVTMQRVSGGGAQPLLLRIEMRARGARLTATSTQPSFLGSYADPRCSAALDLTFVVGMTVAQGAGALLQAAPLPSEPVARLDGFDWSGENAVCSAFRGAVAALGFEGRVRDMVSRQVSAGGAAQQLIGTLQTALGAVNAQVVAQVPPGLSRHQAWAVGPQGAQILALHFGPEAPMPDGSPRATITGRLRVMPARGVVRGGDPPLDCARLPLQAERKAGPSPVINADGELGAPPMEPLQLTSSCVSGPDGTLQHRVHGLSSAFPNVLWATGLSHACVQGERWKSGLVVTLPGRGSQHILPGELARPIDMDVTPMSAPCNMVWLEERDPRDLPPIDQGLAWRTFEELAAGRMTLAPEMVDAMSRFGAARLRPELATGGTAEGRFGAQRGDEVSLNPQPLPPGPDRGALLEEMGRLRQQQFQLQERQMQLERQMMRLGPGR